jgi:hypothetical protein
MMLPQVDNPAECVQNVMRSDIEPCQSKSSNQPIRCGTGILPILIPAGDPPTPPKNEQTHPTLHDFTEYAPKPGFSPKIFRNPMPSL